MVKARSKECLAFGGAIFLCNHLTRKECFEKKIFGLSPYCADFVERIKAGTTLFLFDVDQRKLHGVFEATSDGAVDIIPDAYISAGQRYPSQIRFKRIWFCKPLMEDEFEDAVQKSFTAKNKITYGLSHQQVAKLLHLFSSRNRLQPPQNLRLQDDHSREFEIASLVKETDMQSSPNSSSCGSFRSPCQTCSSSTLEDSAALLGHKLIDPLALVHRVLQSNISGVAKSNSSKSPLHTVPSNQGARDDQSTDDYIPLPQEEDFLEGVDDLFGLLEDAIHSSESKASSDSEDCTVFHQACVRKEDGCCPPRVNSKLHSDIEARRSVFSRLMRTHQTLGQRKRPKTKAFPPRSAESFNLLFQGKKESRVQHNKPFPCHNDGMLDMPSADRLSRIPAMDYSFIWSDNRRSTKFSGGKQSNTQAYLGPLPCKDGNKWNVSTKEPVRYDSCRNLVVPKGCTKWVESCDKELNISPVFSGVHESSEVSAKEETSTPSLNFKPCANDSNVGGDQAFDSKSVEEAGRKKRLALASFHEEYPTDTALVPRSTKTMDIIAISDGNCKEKSISMSSKDTYNQLVRPYLETKVLLQDEQQQNIHSCFEYGEDLTSDTSLVLESSKTVDSLAKHCFSGNLETETSFKENQNQSIRSCHGEVNGDKKLLLGKFETMDILPNCDDDCGTKRSLPSDGSDRLVASCDLETERPLMQKRTPNVQKCSDVIHDGKVLVLEISEVTFPKLDADCGDKGTSLGSDYGEEVCHLVRDCHEVVPSDSSPVLESCGPLSSFPTLHGDSANKNILLDETSEHVSTGHQDTITVSQDKHDWICCGDTSSVLEYSTGDTNPGDGGSELKNSFDQKGDDALYSVTSSKDHRNSTNNTFSSDGSRSYVPTDDQECRKVVLLKEEQYQNFRNRPGLAHENSNSMDSFAVSAEGCGSKNGMSADTTSGHQVADLLGTNSESRTSFFNDSSCVYAETFSTSALGSENEDHNVSGSEVYAEPPILQHDPGEAMKPL